MNLTNMINIFPSKKGYVQTNRSNILGSLWSTMDLDFQSNLGVMRIGSRLEINTATGDSGATNLGVAASFQFFDGRTFALAGTRIFKNSGVDITNPFIEDTSTGASTSYSSDNSTMVLFNNTLCANDANTTLYSKASNNIGTGAWTSRANFPVSPSSMCYFKVFNRLYAAGGHIVSSVDTSWVMSQAGGDYYLDLGFITTQISCLLSDDQSIWIGTNGGKSGFLSPSQECSIYQWDGISAQPSNEYKIPATGIMAMVLRNNIPTIMDSNGILREFTGSYFREIGRLPVKTYQYLNFQTDTSNVQRFINPSGLVVTENNTILALINNQNDYTIDTNINADENIPSGIWEWSAENNFTHKNSVSYTRLGLTTITDFGQNIVSEVGALALVKIPTVASKSIILAGLAYYTNATTITNAIFNDAPKPSSVNYPSIQKKGYFVTTFFLTNQIEEKWERLWNVHKLFKNTTDSIVFKYRLSEVEPLMATITWVDTTHFTTTTDVSAYWTSGTGGEVEILQGTGSGTCSHITNIVNNSGTFTVTLDDIATGVTTGTAIARFQQWIKINPEVNGIIKQWEQMAIGSNSSSIQIKGCLTWTGEGEFWKLAIFSNDDIKINA